MPRTAYFITHAEVEIDPRVAVPQWPLSQKGRARVTKMLAVQPWVSTVTALYSSEEQKALDTANILATHLGLTLSIRAGLGENDRSATGFLPPALFERTADAFFASPDLSILGWERACDAQRRIVNATQALLTSDTSSGAIAIISHGAVGALLYCHLVHLPISREWDQPGNGGGNYFSFNIDTGRLLSGWHAIDLPPNTS